MKFTAPERPPLMPRASARWRWNSRIVCRNILRTEIGSIMIFECERQPGGTHIIQDNFIEEVLDPDTGKPVPYGERTDLLGKKLSADEKEILELYQKLKDLSATGDLPPAVLMNVKQAMVIMWNACRSQDLISEEPQVD